MEQRVGRRPESWSITSGVLRNSTLSLWEDRSGMLTVRVLGSVEVSRDGVRLDLGGPQQLAVIAHLALDVGHVVSVERLIERMWGERLPGTPLGTLRTYVSRLRRELEPGRGAGDDWHVLASEGAGYVLRLEPDAVDAHRFMALLAKARQAAEANDPARAVSLFDDAFALWHGPPLAGLAVPDAARAVVVRLEEERALAVEERFEALLALGRHAEAVPALQSAVGEAPLRERLSALLALALYRASRQADALRVLATARVTLVEQLGLEPGPELRRLEARILAHDAGLLGAPVVRVPAASAGRPAAGLVGRAAEWGALTAALDEVASGGGRFVLLEGDPGIGKSTVAEALLAHAAGLGWHTAVGRCVEPGLAPALWPAVEIARRLVAAGAGRGPIDNPIYSRVTAPDPAQPGLTPVELADAFGDLVGSLGLLPLVLLLDDLHWADRPTLDVLAAAAARIGPLPVLTIGTFRPPQLVPGSVLAPTLGKLARRPVVRRVTLAPLAIGEVAELIELTTGTAPSPAVAERVHSRAGGNPLFVTELARLAGADGVQDAAVPAAIRDVVRGRLAQLPAETTRQLQVAAVLGERFDLHTLVAAGGGDRAACLDAFEPATVARIVEPAGDGYRFAHALVRDAVLAELSPLQRARLHKRAAEAILAVSGDGPDQAEPIAYHRLAAADVDDPVVVSRAAVRASAAARRSGALDRADELAGRALEVLESVAPSADVELARIGGLEALVSAASRRGPDDRSARNAVREALAAFGERADHDPARALALFLPWVEIDARDDVRSVPMAAIERLAARTTEPYAAALTRYMLASVHLLRGELGAAQIEIERFSAAAARGPAPRVGIAPFVAAMTYATLGEADAARAHAAGLGVALSAERARADQRAPLARALSVAFVEAVLGDAEAVRAIPITGAGTEGLPSLQVLRGWARARLGDPAGAEAAWKAMDAVDHLPLRTFRSALRAFLGHALLDAGDERAVDVLERAQADATARGELWWLAETIRLRALAERRFGEPVHAAELLEAAAELATRQGAGVVLARLAAAR